MKRLVKSLIILLLRALLWFRYRIEIKGLEKLTPEALNKPGGVLFLPNHPAMLVDPCIVTLGIWKKFPLRPLIIEYMYYHPVIYPVMKSIRALPVPNMDAVSNQLKRQRSEEVFKKVIKGLKCGDNFLIYPAGQLKDTGKEELGGASGAHRVVQEVPEANVVLVRTTGLWGSCFSRAYTGKSPPIGPQLWFGLKKLLKNFLFFIPRRPVTVEFEPAGPELPREASRLEFNGYLETWYNKPFDGGEPLLRVSYSIWSRDVLEVPEDLHQKEEPKVDLSRIKEEVQQKVIGKIAEITDRPVDSIEPEQKLSTDLGMDSLDIAELVTFLDDEFDIAGIPTKKLVDVKRVIAVAAGQVPAKEAEENGVEKKKWFRSIEKERIYLASGKTIPEVFLNSCSRHGARPACADSRSGILTFKTMKLRAILLAEHLRTLPGEHLGILLPSSVAACVCFLAVQLAGKIPVMINWTLGKKHLESVVEISGIERVLSSWAFLDRLPNVDLSPIDSMIIQLEDLRGEFSLIDKLKALFWSKRGTRAVLSHFELEELSEEETSVLLFTSGTEAAPKGVPLSHKNQLSNQRAVFDSIEIFSDDVFLAILPPFHAFGLTVSSLFGPLSGMRTAFFPDPTDGKGLAKSVKRWGATLICGAPTFLKGMLKAASPEELDSLRYVVSGAEKAPQDLFDMMDRLGMSDKILEGYGITECAPVMTVNRPGEESAGVGKPLPGVRLLIVDPDSFEPRERGKKGLILTRGPNVFKGYKNRDLESPFVEVEGEQWYNTGDLGILDEKGRLSISGREKRFVKLGAEMISLAAIENGLLQMASEKKWELREEGPSLAVTAKEREGERAQIYLFTLFPLSTSEANQALREAGFSNLVKISKVIQVDEIPIMGTGKIFYRKLESEHLSV